MWDNVSSCTNYYVPRNNGIIHVIIDYTQFNTQVHFKIPASVLAKIWMEVENGAY